MKLISSSGTTSGERFGIGGTNGGSALWIDANSTTGWIRHRQDAGADIRQRQ